MLDVELGVMKHVLLDRTSARVVGPLYDSYLGIMPPGIAYAFSI